MTATDLYKNSSISNLFAIIYKYNSGIKASNTLRKQAINFVQIEEHKAMPPSEYAGL